MTYTKHNWVNGEAPKLNATNLLEIDTALETTTNNAVDKRDFDAKGDLLVGSADNAYDNLTVGTNAYVLIADSNQTLGVKWDVLAVAGGGTGATTLTANALLVGNTTSAISAPGPTLSATTLTFGGAGIINSTTSSALTVDSGTTGAVNLGTGATAKVVTIGNVTGATSIVLNAGSGNITITSPTIVLNGASSGTISITPPAAAGTNTLTLPAETGAFITTANPLAKRVAILKVFDDTTALAAGNGKMYFAIPLELTGYNLVQAEAFVSTASTTGTIVNVQVYSNTLSHDMLSTAITIDNTEYTSFTADARSAVDTNYDNVTTGDLIQIDVDATGTGAKGLGVILSFAKP